MTKTHHSKRKTRSPRATRSRSRAQARVRRQPASSPLPARPHAAGDIPADVRVALNVIREIKSMAEAEAAGAPPAPQAVAEQLIECYTPLLGPEVDQLTVELTGGMVMGLLRRSQPDGAKRTTALRGLIMLASAHRTPQALAMLRVFTTAGHPVIRATADRAADQMVADGVAELPWSSGLGSPVPGPCFGLADESGCFALGVTFGYRGRRQHGFYVAIGETGGIADCLVLDDAQFVRDTFRQTALEPGEEYRDYSRAAARAILEDALGRPPCPLDPVEAENVEMTLDLLRSRAALL